MTTTTPMLRTYLHRRGHIPTSVHPFEKAGIQEQAQPQQKTFWLYPFVSNFYVVLVGIPKSLQQQFRRSS